MELWGCPLASGFSPQLTLTRNAFGVDGIFGTLEGAGLTLATLEHAFPADVGYLPAVPPGMYTCQRGLHQLEGMSSNFTTFQIMNVPGHTGILFHVGNSNRDSSGCCLLGETRQGTLIINSRLAFAAFMQALLNITSFQLAVVNPS